MKKVAIIGAGASGLTAIKCCLDEGLEPVCYERTDEIGGLWNFKEEVRPGQACVMKSTVINTSKEMMCYSDFPIPREYPIFMHNTYVLKYFHLYAREFGLTKYIKFKTEIVSVKKCSDFATTGKWDITIKDITTGKTEDLVYDAVLICTGHHADINMPTLPGLDKFQGKVLHSRDVKSSSGYEDKRVLVVGIGNSGGDAAVELSHVTSKVFLSTRRGTWVWNRVGDNGMPIDMSINRFVQKIFSTAPKLCGKILESRMNGRFDHTAYSLKPNFSILSQHPMVNDDLPNRIISGSIMIKSNVAEFTESGVRFDDGTFEEGIDVVILATGYVFGFPFLDSSVIEVKDNKVELYKYAFPPDLEKQTLAIVGFIQPLGSLVPIIELQCRLATRVFKGDATLPCREDMWSDILAKSESMARQYVKSPRHTMQVPYIPFMTELATLNGCYPNLKSTILSDPTLALKLIFGPFTPYQFRLEGPGQWKGAREAIMTQWDRTLYPLKTRALGYTAKESSNMGCLFFLVIAVSICVLLISYLW